MRSAYDVDAVRAAESAAMAGGPDGVLMQRAAAGLAAVCAEMLGRVYGTRVLLLVGSGDNGGDALWAGARLARRGAAVDALLLSERVHAAALAALRAAGGRVVDDLPGRGDKADGADLVVDGIIGIGGSGGLRERAASVVQRLAAAGTPVVAVDLPSGVDASTGEVAGAAVRSDVTVTFGAWKTGLLVDPGAGLAGRTVLVDIGLPDPGPPALESLQAGDVAVRLPRPDVESDKYRRGVVGVVAGSRDYTGAALLAVGGALHGGAGMVRFAGDDHPAELVRARWPEVVVGRGRVQAWAVGPGMGTDDDAGQRLAAVLAEDVPALVDADGLTMLAKDRTLLADRSAPTLLTPHAGELARLLGADRGDVEARRLEHVRRAADDLGVTVLLKGSTTLVADPGSAAPVRVNATGTPWLGTAGSGDVLSGLGAALLGSGLDPRDAGSVAAFLHGLAGRLASEPDVPITAQDVLAALPRAWARVEGAERPPR